MPSGLDPSTAGHRPGEGVRETSDPPSTPRPQSLPPPPPPPSPGRGNSDYGFAVSWPSVPLPQSPGDAAARVITNERGGREGVGATSRYNASVTLGIDGQLAEDLPRGEGAGSAGAGAAGGETDALASVVNHHGGDNRSSDGGRLMSDHSSIPGLCAEASLDRSGGIHGFPYADGCVHGAGIGPRSPPAGRTGRSQERSSSGTPEQVSLPEDVYGAARVPEYWHGMHALSSLASAYVYDDIWAGDGGLNTREDTVEMSPWANQEQRKASAEVATEAGLRLSNLAERGKNTAAAGLPRNWSRGSDLAQEGAGGRRGDEQNVHLAGAGEQEITLIRSWKNRDEDGSGSGSGSRNSGGRDGGAGGHGNDQPEAQAHVWSVHRDDGVVENVGEAMAARGQRGDSASVERAERRGVRRRRTPSFDGTNNTTSVDEAHKSDADSDGQPASKRSSTRVAGPSPSSPAFPMSSSVAPASIAPLNEAAGIHAARAISSGDSIKVAEATNRGSDVERQRAVETAGAPTLSHSRETLETRWFNFDSVENDLYKVNWDLTASIASGAKAPATSSMAMSLPTPSTSSSGEDETFFAEHTLEPKPRPGWEREVFMEGEGRDTPSYRLPQGMGIPRWGQRTEIHGTVATATTAPSDATAAARISLPSVFEGARECLPGGIAVASPAAAAAAAAAVEEQETATIAASSPDSKFEWEVRPETMAHYFTSVIDLVPPLVPPVAPATHLLYPNNGVVDHNMRRGNAGRNGATLAGGVASAPGGAGEEQDANAGWQAETAPAPPGTNQSCSMSCEGGGGGEEEGSWGW